MNPYDIQTFHELYFIDVIWVKADWLECCEFLKSISELFFFSFQNLVIISRPLWNDIDLSYLDSVFGQEDMDGK